MERGGPDDHERQDETRPEQGQQSRRRRPSQEHQKRYHRRHGGTGDQSDEEGLHDPTPLVPALARGNHATYFGERRLEVELLVDAEREEQEGNDGPDARLRSRVVTGRA